ncbi:MAG: hypothetical protein DLM69_11450 [Candidatus Chloroheliales bacterium]|nr:MAG: hypothetical protein DLM69_11450 [Chloroflexota bacterium]
MISALLFAMFISLLLLPGQSASAGSPPNKQTPSTTADFEDVPTSYLFYSFIHNLYVDGIIAGYPCGTPPAGPCGTPPLPYYLPGTNVTRAQMSKYADLSRRNIADAAGRSLSVESVYTGSTFHNGVINAINDNLSAGNTAAIFARGPVGIWATAAPAGTIIGTAGLFYDYGGSSGAQYGIDAGTAQGIGIRGSSAGTTSSQLSIGVEGSSSAASGIGVLGLAPMTTDGSAGGNFAGRSGVTANGNGATTGSSSDGLDVGGSGGTSYAIFSSQPTGNSNYTLYGSAQVHGTNISGQSYQVEVRYHGVAPAQLGAVLALDGHDEMMDGSNVIGVVEADATNAVAAIGVLSFRLGSAPVNNSDKTFIDSAASSIKAGDRAYVTIVGETRMKFNSTASIGSRVVLGSDGHVNIASKGNAINNSNVTVVGKVASAADKDGYVTVFVNLK